MFHPLGHEFYYFICPLCIISWLDILSDCPRRRKTFENSFNQGSKPLCPINPISHVFFLQPGCHWGGGIPRPLLKVWFRASSFLHSERCVYNKPGSKSLASQLKTLDLRNKLKKNLNWKNTQLKQLLVPFPLLVRLNLQSNHLI